MWWTVCKNPFHASFGVSPRLLVGRDDLLDEFAEALEDGPGSAGRATLYTGARSAGKTVMLNAVEDRAREQGWLIVSETANPGFVSRITQQHLPRLLRDFDPKAVQRRISSVSAPLHICSLTWSTIEAHVVPSHSEDCECSARKGADSPDIHERMRERSAHEL